MDIPTDRAPKAACADHAPSLPAGGGRRIAITHRNRAALLAAIGERLDAGQGFALATLNLDHLVKLRRSARFREAYAAQDMVVADGNPVVWLTRLSGRPASLVPGSELVRPVAALAAARSVPVAFVGATEATLGVATARLEAECPGLRVVARIAPPFGFDPEGADGEACLRTLAASSARLCILALGAPRQEVFAARARRELPNVGFLSLGAGLDFVAGSQRRAPAWVRRLTLEWFWRLALQPRRMAGRYLACALILPALALDALGLRGR